MDSSDISFKYNLGGVKNRASQQTDRFRMNRKMSMCFPSTPKKMASTVGCFLTGAALFAYGLHLSYVNVAPQQARTKARSDFGKMRSGKGHSVIVYLKRILLSDELLCELGKH
ncbi:hypothetical protein F8388_016782 [Cannabis sativa]|uniref:Uncharacterized protein n=1 Tax=Cannabis sativa TaxID=3483 RepID=A0A7J6ERC4_CANSA|nr:hypothetical protein F8388_016782 [Cannabis sativa]